MSKLVVKKSSRPTGLASVGWRPHYDILYKRMYIGNFIETSKYSNLYRIRFHIIKDDIKEDGNSNCSWMWKYYTNKTFNINDAKIFLDENIKEILKQNIYYIEK